MAKQRSGPRPLGDLVTGELTAPCRRRGLADATLIVAWEDIAPRHLAAECRIERIDWPRQGAAGGDAGATLVLAATPNAALVLAHGGEPLMDRINAVFGWRAVTRLKVVQRPAPAHASRPARPTPTDADRARAARHAAGIDHAKLNAALLRLGGNVYARSGGGGAKTP